MTTRLGDLALKMRREGEGTELEIILCANPFARTEGEVQCPLSMKRLAISDGIERVEPLLAELKAIAHWDKDYWSGRHNGLGEIIAHISRCRRKVEIISELVAIISAMYWAKSDSRRRGLQRRKARKRSFLRMV